MNCTPDDPDAWRQRAACREHDADLWFPDPKDVSTREAAIRICRGCPVMSQCKAEKKRIRASYGVWAGKFVNNLENYISSAPRRVKPCGTPAAHRRHVRHGEEPCLACKGAINMEHVKRYQQSVERRANR